MNELQKVISETDEENISKFMEEVLQYDTQYSKLKSEISNQNFLLKTSKNVFKNLIEERGDTKSKICEILYLSKSLDVFACKVIIKLLNNIIEQKEKEENQ